MAWLTRKTADQQWYSTLPVSNSILNLSRRQATKCSDEHKAHRFRRDVQGFGTWRIVYDPAAKKWRLDYNVRARGEHWKPIRRFDVAESAAFVLAERETGFGP